MATNRKLEDLFGLEPVTDNVLESQPPEPEITPEQVTTALVESRSALSDIAQALPAVRELQDIDAELDAISEKAMASFEELSDLGMQVDSRFAAEIFSVASSMMGHALTAKTAKATRKLKTIEMQMKKLKLEHDLSKSSVPTAPAGIIPGSIEHAQGKVLSRNELMEQLMGPRTTNDEK